MCPWNDRYLIIKFNTTQAGPTTTTTTTIFIRAQKLHSIDLNTREKKKNYKRKEHSHLEIAKLIKLSGWAKRNEIC